jgi:hypothetical protein
MRQKSIRMNLKENREVRRGLRLTERDTAAIGWICEQGVATLDQLWLAFWRTESSDSKSYTYRRLLHLIASGYLTSQRTHLKQSCFYAPTELGRRTAEMIQRKDFPLVVPPSVEFIHAEKVSDIRLSLQRAGKLGSWKSDRMLLTQPGFPKERFRSYVPDALWITPTKTRVLIEYERALKGVPRLKRKVEAFSREMGRTDRFMDHVLWIGEPDRIPELQKAIGSDSRHTVRTFPEFETELFMDRKAHAKR